jgi:competence protein ComEC
MVLANPLRRKKQASDHPTQEDQGASEAKFSLSHKSPEWGLLTLIFAQLKLEWLTDQLRAELDNGRGFLWGVVAFAIGILIYFSLPAEPLPFIFPLCLGLFLIIARRHWHGVSFYSNALLVMVLAGLSAGQLRTQWVAAPVLQSELKDVGLRGWVEMIETFPTGQKRLTLRVISIEDLPQAQTPLRVRIRFAQKDFEVSAGDAIWVRTDLRPTPEPVAPYLYDFSKLFFYQGIGATGFTLSKPREAWNRGSKPWGVALRQGIEGLRDELDIRIKASFSDPYASLASALIVGKRKAIPEDVQEMLRISGLAHILAISGLHMGLVTAFVFFLVRGLLALNMHWAGTYPLRQWAAFSALGVAACYLLLSGMAVATVRAFIMASLVLIAIVAGRKALTMRTVAVAALIILCLWPEALLSPGFQMSFAAVIALVATYEGIMMKRRENPKVTYYNSVWGRTGRILLIYFGGLCLTSLIAGLATGPVALFHFNRIAPYSLLGNVLAMPFVAFIVMPAGLLGTVLVPFGLESIPYFIMEQGLETVLSIAKWVAVLPGSESWQPKPPLWIALLASFGFLWLMLWQRRWRFLGFLPLFAAVPLSAMAERPDLLIARDGKTVAVRHEDSGKLEIAGLRYGRFDAESWLRADGDGRAITKAVLNGAWQCDNKLCLYMRQSQQIILILDENEFNNACSRLNRAYAIRIVITPLSLRDTALLCENAFTHRFDSAYLKQYGALSASLSAHDKLHIKQAYPQRTRPWEK